MHRVGSALWWVPLHTGKSPSAPKRFGMEKRGAMDFHFFSHWWCHYMSFDPYWSLSTLENCFGNLLWFIVSSLLDCLLHVAICGPRQTFGLRGFSKAKAENGRNTGADRCWQDFMMNWHHLTSLPWKILKHRQIWTDAEATALCQSNFTWTHWRSIRFAGHSEVESIDAGENRWGPPDITAFNGQRSYILNRQGLQ